MQFLFNAIERTKGKPHHVRHRVAVAISATCAGLVGMLWLGVSLSHNAFAIKGTTFAQSVGATETAETVNETRSQNVAGAAAALDQKSEGPARVQIVNIVATSSPTKTEDQTIIPF